MKTIIPILFVIGICLGGGLLLANFIRFCAQADEELAREEKAKREEPQNRTITGFQYAPTIIGTTNIFTERKFGPTNPIIFFQSREGGKSNQFVQIAKGYSMMVTIRNDTILRIMIEDFTRTPCPGCHYDILDYEPIFKP